ncbi:MAG TPA: hypothetical protein VFV38_30260 [Ktedonobacteraceae bacterium]|nr:hypothetical protein [Ktedonobacteraceae bacterium]
MGEDYTDLFIYTRQQEEIFEPRKFQRLAEGLAALGFFVAWPGESADRSTLTSAGISPTVQKEIEAAREKTAIAWLLQVHSFDQNSSSDGFTFHIGNDRIDEEDAEYGALDLDFPYRVFDESPNGVALYEHFLEAVRLIYEVYHPIYGYQYDPRDSRSPTTREEALTLEIHHLYDINLFGPELVEKLGCQRVESTPAQKVIPLDDGGMLLLPRIFFHPDAIGYTYQQVAAHLGFSSPE